MGRSGKARNSLSKNRSKAGHSRYRQQLNQRHRAENPHAACKEPWVVYCRREGTTRDVMGNEAIGKDGWKVFMALPWLSF